MIRRGLTLLEMMIALALTGMVAYIALDMFAGQQANYTRTREKVKLQDDAREVMRIIEEDVRNAGYRTTVSSEATGLAGSIGKCGYVLDKDSAAFTAGNRNTIAGDTLRIRYVEPSSIDGQVTCGYGSGTSFREIGYLQRNDTLFRRLRSDTTSASEWVEMLSNVVTFQVEYGLLTDPTDQIATSVQLATAANWAGSGSMTASTLGSAVTLTNWKTAGAVVACYKNPVSVDPRYTYRITFDLSMSANMRVGVDGIDSSTTSQLPKFAVGFFNSTAGTPTDTLYAYPQDPSLTSRRIEVLLSPATAGTRYLGFQTIYKTGANINSTQSVTISNASLSVVSRGQYFSWLNSPTASQGPHVKALRVNLLAKAAMSDGEGDTQAFSNLDASGLSYSASGADTTRTHILYQRIIPVVNNGN
ncbi:MAG: prepilin-type N-terminal cleavage/methylation domain-containing protein [Fibrobacteres bacterium]|nr:prepilin-type N-terminal cleavage/methylation domain-containing protein [Fibrobacterota bacterium]